MRKQQFIPATILAAMLATSPAMAVEKLVEKPTSAMTKDAEQEVMLIDEDFSKVTAGSESAPALDFNINTCVGEPPENIFYSCVDPSYTKQPGWGSYMVYPAGGTLYFNNTRSGSGYAAHLNAPLFDASDCNGTFFIRFRARLTSPNPQYAGLGISVQDATDPDNLQWISFSNLTGMTSDEWKTYEMRLEGGTKQTRLILREEYGVNVLIDDIQIFQKKTTIESPHVLRYLYYNGTSFRPRWNKVEGATKYYVNVFESDATGSIGKSIVSDFETTDTICTVRGLTPGVYYRYNVAASDGTTRSLTSRNMVLNDILAPALNDVEISEGKYTASWEAVPGALFYNYYVYADRTAEADGEFTLVDEDFNGITDAGGLQGYTDDLTGQQVVWTPGNEPDTWHLRPYSSPLNTKMAGYYANNWIAFDGNVFLDGWFYFFDQKDDAKDPETDDDVKEYGKFETPVLNLANDGGKLKVSTRLWGMPDKDTTTGITYQTNANIALVTFDAVLNQYVETEKYHFDLSAKWTDVNCEFTTGGEDSKVVIYAADGPGAVYIDNLKITQQLKKGDTFASCIACQTGLTTTSTNVTLPEGAEDSNLYHRAIAVTEHESKVLSRTYYYYSGPSELTQFHEGTGSTAINSTAASNNATIVARYAIDGTRLAAPTKGINIVKMSDGTTRKIVIE